MECTKNTTNEMSDLCLEAWYTGSNETENCFPDRSVSGLFSAVWCMINGGIGFTGNLLTILAIPFCAKKKMPNFISRDVFFDIHIIVETPLEVKHLINISLFRNRIKTGNEISGFRIQAEVPSKYI